MAAAATLKTPLSNTQKNRPSRSWGFDHPLWRQVLLDVELRTKVSLAELGPVLFGALRAVFGLEPAKSRASSNRCSGFCLAHS